MSASYPSAVKSFSPLVDGTNYPQAVDVNQLYDEVTALEQALLSTGLAHDLKFVDATYDIGKSGATRPRDLFLSRNAVIGGTLGVTGVATFTAQSVHAAGVDISGAGAGQVVFPATQNASSGANTLDDYEEGTCTASLVCGTSGTITVDSSFNTLQYTKVGNQVCVTGYITISAISSPVGTLTLNGLPFTVASKSQRSGYAACSLFMNVLAAGDQWMGQVNGGGTAISFFTFSAGTATSATRANQVQVGTVIQLSLTFFTT